MNRGKRIICYGIIVCILAGVTGCQRRNNDSASEVASIDATKDTGVTTEEPQNTDPLSVENQLKTIAEHAKKWRKMEYEDDPFDSMKYAVTDLDQNGRLEMIASSGTQGSGRFTYTNYFQVNPTGDGFEKLKTVYQEGVSEADIVENLSTAYYDPDTKEYHYITGDFATAGLAVGYYSSVSALTLRKNTIVDDTLGYKEHIVKKSGRTKNRYFQTFSKKEKEIDASEYSEEMIGDKAYAKCGKLSVNVSWFGFERSIEDMTEEQTLYYLRKSYEAFSLGYPLAQKKKTVSGFKIKLPQYIGMQDQEKQKRLNQMIKKIVEKDFNKSFGLKTDQAFHKKYPFHLWYFGCTIKYAGKDRVSILAEGQGYRKMAAHPTEWCYTINIDIGKETILSQTDILPKEYRETVGNLIMEKNCVDIRGGKSYRKLTKDLCDGKLLEEPEDWEDVEVYQTPDSFGIVLSTSYAAGSYAIYEVWKTDVIEEE